MNTIHDKHILDMIKTIIPNLGLLEIKGEVDDHCYSITFFVTIEGNRLQCYEIVDMGYVDEDIMDDTMESIANYLRSIPEYTSGKTFCFDAKIKQEQA